MSAKTAFGDDVARKRGRPFAVMLALVAASACGAATPVTHPYCPPGQTSLDGTCVSQPIADYVACIRATGASVASNTSQALSAAAGVAGVTASTQAEVQDKLEKNYATVSDANVLEIIHDCHNKTAPRDEASAPSDVNNARAPSEMREASEAPVTPAGRWRVPGGSPGATIAQATKHLTVTVEGAPSVAYGTVSGSNLDVQFAWVPGCCTGTLSPDGNSIFWSNNSTWYRR